MEIELLKKYLQVYLDDVITPRANKELVGEEDEPITIKVYDIVKGSYQPPIYHIFIDIYPSWKGSYLKTMENYINQFMKMFSINSPIKIHWNKRPAFKNTEKSDSLYGMRNKR